MMSVMIPRTWYTPCHPNEAARVGTMAFVAVTPRDEAINKSPIARPRLPRSNQLTISLMQDA